MTTMLAASATPTITYAPATGVFTYTWLLIALPLFGAVFLMVLGDRTIA